MLPEQFRTWSALLSEAVLLVTKGGRVLAVNEAVRQLGFEPLHFEQKTLFDLSATSQQEIREFLRLCSRTRQPVVTAITLRSHDEKEIVCRCDGMLAQHESEGGETTLLLKLTSKETSVRHYQLVNEKISDLNQEIQRRIALEKELQERNEYLHVTLSSIGDGVIVTDGSGRVSFMNSIAEQLTGWTTESANGFPLDDVFRIVNETTRHEVENPASRSLRVGKIVGLANHTLLLAKDGTARPIDDSAAPIYSKEGEVLGAVLVFRDVAERRQAEKELQASEARKRAMFETALDSIIKMDQAGIVVDFNPAAEKTFGYCSSEAIGRELAELIIPVRLREQHRQGLAHFLATGEGPVLGRHLELTALHADGSEFPVEVAITHVPLDGSSLFTAYLRDITERKQVEQYRNARHDATRILTAATTLQEALEGVLGAICRNLEWEMGFFWSLDEQENVLFCQEGYCQSQVSNSAFRLASRQRRFRRGEDLPGSVWAKSGPVWILDVTRQVDFPRAASAAEDGLHSAFACPVIVGEQTQGVIEFFNTSIKEPDADLLEMTETVAGHLGQFIERKFTEEQLHQSVEQLTDFFHNATIGLHWVGPDATIIKVNQAELELLGYSRDEYVGRSIRDFHADEDVISDILDRLQAGKNLRDYPARLVCKDGSIKEVLIDSSVMWKDGQFIHTRCFTRDVTDRNQAEIKLREQEQQTRSILESITDAFFAVDQQWRFTYINSQAERLIRRKADFLLGRVIWEAYPGLKGTEFERAYREAASQQQTLCVTAYYPDYDSWYEAHVYPATEGISVYFRDVSERKRNEAILGAQKRALELLVHGAPLPDVLDALCEAIEGQSQQQLIATVLLLDEEGRHLRSTAGRRVPEAYAQAVDGVAIGPCVGSCGTAAYRSEQVIVSDIETDPLWADFRELALGYGLRACWSTPIFSSADGVLGTFAVYALSPGRPTSGQLSLIDVLARTAGIAIERRRDEEKLRIADRRKDEFLATLAHELRNPLAPIRTGLEVMKLSQDDPDTVEEMRQTMERQTQQLIALVDDLLDVSRITRGKFELRKSQVKMANVLQSAIETSKSFIIEARHDFSVSIPDVPIYLHADPHRLAQVVSNLLNNAAKYTPEGGQISLVVEPQDDIVLVSVTDNGIGIPAEMREQIFEMFAQIEHLADKAYAGLGIGLTLVRSLVELHDGQITVESQGRNRGSTFRVRLPILKTMTEAEQKPAPVATSNGGGRVLIVDDNQAAAKMLGIVVKKLGNEVRCAGDGKEAIEVAAAFRPQVILMDIGMPKMNGYEAAQHIRQQAWGRDMALIALTGWGQEDDQRRTKEAGFDHHLTKPAEPADLKKLLRDLTDSKGAPHKGNK